MLLLEAASPSAAAAPVPASVSLADAAGVRVERERSSVPAVTPPDRIETENVREEKCVVCEALFLGDKSTPTPVPGAMWCVSKASLSR